MKNVVKTVGRTLKKYSPEILIGLGVVGFGGSVVLACKATKKSDEVKAETTKAIEEARVIKEDVAVDPKVARKELACAYGHAAVEYTKLYLPTVVTFAGATVCTFGGFGIIKNRYIKTFAELSNTLGFLAGYRERVREAVGEEAENKLYLGIKDETITVEEIDPETGKKKKKKEIVQVADDVINSPYAKWFDESCADWRKDPEANKNWLLMQQEYATDKLVAQGHLFLNEVYDSIGIPRTPIGSVAGWIYDPENPDGDNFVDFGIFDNIERNRDFVNGRERSILLNFNVQGIIYDKI